MSYEWNFNRKWTMQHSEWWDTMQYKNDSYSNTEFPLYNKSKYIQWTDDIIWVRYQDILDVEMKQNLDTSLWNWFQCLFVHTVLA